LAKRRSHAGHGHLYRHGAKGARKRQFQKRYGKKKGAYVYGAVVGKVKRQREAKRGWG